jgi:glyoxylase-like metal-dependent hydrolase (beta-lactamase superfamily II)
VESTNYTIEVIRNRFFPSNTYVLTLKGSRKSILIDPGLDLEAIRQRIEEMDIQPVGIVATHGHFDHIGSVAFLQAKYNIPYYLHELDVKISKAANFFLKMVKLDIRIETPVPDRLFKGKNERVGIDDFEFDVYNLPGHTEGSCVIQFENSLFSGDLVYREGLGFNHFPGENKGKLKVSLQELSQKFSGENVMIYPGHGDKALLSEIQENNKELIDFLNGNNE